MSPVRRARRLLVPFLKLTISVALIAILLARIDTGALWAAARGASPVWLAAALGAYGVMILMSAWRWGLLLRAQNISLSFRTLAGSFLVATFFNNFLPSNIGGDVVRITDTAAAAGSKTRAGTVVLMDRALGLLGLVLVAAVGATALTVGGGDARQPVAPGVLWAGFGAAALLLTPALLIPDGFVRILGPLQSLRSEWIDERIARLGCALTRFSAAPGAIAGCFAGAVAVQGVLVMFYLAIARSMEVPIGLAELAVVVPITLVVQMVPISMNGFGVREATFGFYFSRLGLPLESALLVSFVGAALILIVSVSGGVAYLLRLRAARPAAA